MDALCTLPFILVFITRTGECRINFPLPCTDHTLFYIPILSGKLNSNFAKGKLVSKIFVRLRFLQTFYDFLVTFHEAKLALRLMYNFLLYGHDRTQLSVCNGQAFAGVCNDSVVDLVNVYRILHYLAPEATTHFLDPIMVEIEGVCPKFCIQDTGKVGHHRFLKWIRHFLMRYFDTKQENQLSFTALNRIAFWPLILDVCREELLSGMFHFDTLRTSEKCQKMLHEFLKVRNRLDAIELEQSLSRRCR